MIDQLVSQLHSPDPNQRRQAIIALGKSKNPAAMPHLAQIYRSDPEPSLRELARKAGVHIRQAADAGAAAASTPATRSAPPPAPAAPQVDDDEPDFYALLGETTPAATSPPPAPVREAAPPPPPAPVAPSAPAAAVMPVRGRTYEVSRENVQRAKLYVEQALSMNISGDNGKAMKMLAQGLAINPNLVSDGYFMSIAASVTGLEGDGAVQMILDSGQRKGFVQQAQQRKKQERIEKHLTEARRVTWASTWFEIIIFTLIVSIGPVLQVLVTAESARAFLGSLPVELAEDPQIQQAFASVNDYTATSLLITGVISGIGGVISLLIQTVFIHYGATLILGGHGTLRYLLELLLGFYNKWLPIIFLLSYITVAVVFISGLSPVVLCLVLPLVLLSLYVSGKTSGKIGAAYDFGMTKGCLAYFISIVIIVVISVVLTIIAGQAFGIALQSLVPSL